MSKKSNLATQLAFCKHIGFGTTRNADEADSYLRDAKLPNSWLEETVRSSRLKHEPSNDLLKKLYATGVIQPIHNAGDFKSLSRQRQAEIREAREQEFLDVQSCLGPTHPAVLNLKWTYSTMPMENMDLEPSADFDFFKPSNFLKSIVDDLSNDEAYGENHIDTIMANAYYTASLLSLPSFDALEESMQKCLRLRDRLREAGRENHVITVMMDKYLASCFDKLLRYKEADEYFEKAKAGTKAIFGDDHQNTVVLLSDEAKSCLLRGNTSEAEKKYRECLKHMERLIGKKSMEFLQLQGQFVELLIVSRNFKGAQAELERAKVLLNDHKFHEKHPGYIVAHQAAARINMELGKYKEAAQDATKALAIISRFPWPPKAVLPDLPHPDKFPRNPNQMMLEAIRCTALVAQCYYDAPSGEKPPLTVSLEREAEAGLEQLLREINQCLGDGKGSSDEVPTAQDGVAGSAMYRAMEQGPAIPVELLAMLGEDGEIGRAHV